MGRRTRAGARQVLEMHVARKERRPADRTLRPPYGPGVGQRALSDFEAIADEPATRGAEPATRGAVEDDA